MAAPVLLAHPSSLGHDTGAHPEQAARILAIEQELSSRGWLGYRRLESAPARREDLARVHPESHIEAIEQLSAAGGGYIDPDTVTSRGSYEAALHGAGGAVQAAGMVLRGDAPIAFSLHRPPGHHASASRAMGFCLFNSVAVAAQHALDQLGCERVMVFDWDVHHGNGTSDIFYASDRVLFCSIHQSPLYPGTGGAEEMGRGEGLGYTVNLPVPPGSGDADWMALVQHVVVPLALRFSPSLLLVSAGYDGHREDNLANCRLSEQGYAAMARAVRGASIAGGFPMALVLEGGYALGALARSVAATLEALAGQPTAVHESPAVPAPGAGTPEATAALARLRRWWPDLPDAGP